MDMIQLLEWEVAVAHVPVSTILDQIHHVAMTESTNHWGMYCEVFLARSAIHVLSVPNSEYIHSSAFTNARNHLDLSRA